MRPAIATAINKLGSNVSIFFRNSYMILANIEIIIDAIKVLIIDFKPLLDSNSPTFFLNTNININDATIVEILVA